MPVYVEYNDITKYKGDAIVNSLGHKYDIPGEICENILKKVNDKRIINQIINHNLNYGEIKITNAGELPVKKIINIYTPYKFYDDENNTALINMYKKIIQIAIENNLINIALPLIGAGANGYTVGESYTAALEASKDIIQQEVDKDIEIISLTIMPFKKPRKRRTEDDDLEDDVEGICRSYSKIEHSGSFVIQKQSLYQEEESISLDVRENYQTILEVLENLNYDEFLKPKAHKYQTPFDFLIEYMIEHDIDDKVLSEGTLGKKRKSRFKTYPRMQKKDVYALSFIVGLDLKHTIQFLIAAGHMFSPIDPLDMFYLNYLLGKYKKVKTLVELDILALEHGVEIQFTYNHKN